MNYTHNDEFRTQSKIYSPHTSRKENLPFEHKIFTRGAEKSIGSREAKKSCLSSSKISSWAEAMTSGGAGEMSSNLYRNRETLEPQTSTYKRNKSSRSNASTKRKRKKHHLSIGQPLEKQKTIDNTNKKNFTNQLITLIQKLHSPKNNKSHNHSHSEVYSQGVKKIVRSKNGQHYKAAK